MCPKHNIGFRQRKNQGQSQGGSKKTPLAPCRIAIHGHPSEEGAPWLEVACAFLPTSLGLMPFLLLVLTALGLFWCTSLAAAASVTLAWDASAAPELTGYKLYYGYASRSYRLSVNVGQATTAALSGLDEAKGFCCRNGW